MICKKCGANIEGNSKFCGVCGERVEKIINPVVNNVIQQTPVDQSEQIDQTVIIEPVSSSVEPEIQQPIKSIEPKKKKNTWIFVLGGVLLGIVALVLLIIAFSKGSNSDIKVLEKALGNFEQKGENSGTVDVKLLLESETQDSMNLTATVKYAKQGDDDYNLGLTLNKSMLFDEISVYASYLDDNLTLFANSTLIDMLGFTSSTPSMWVKFTMTEEQLEITDEVEVEDDGRYYLRNVLDENHFKLIGEENNLRHYQLVIDNELLNKIKAQAPSEEELKEFEDSLAEINNGSTELTQTYYVDLYINDSDELVKIAMDLSDSLNDDTVKKAVLSLEFRDFGTTSVLIPQEAKNSTLDLETYMATYAIKEETPNNSYVDPTLNQSYINQY